MPAFPVSHAPLKQSDLKDSNLSALNQQIRHRKIRFTDRENLQLSGRDVTSKLAQE